VPYYLTGSRITLNGKTYLAGVGIEMTELKRLEDEVRECEENLKAFLDNAPDGIVIHDMKGTVLDLNRNAEELIGLSRKEFIGKNVMDAMLIGKQRLPVVMDGMKELKKGRANKPIEFEFKNKNDPRVIEITGFPITRNGEMQVCDILRDITKVKTIKKLLLKKIEDSLTFNFPTAFYTSQTTIGLFAINIIRWVKNN